MLDAAEQRRFSRHIMLPEVGLLGQEKLKAAKVLLIGAGGLGSPVSLYLAAAGVGSLGIVDFDTVDESNLQRQILFRAAEVGRLKAEIAKLRLLELNPSMEVTSYTERLSIDNSRTIFASYDLVVDGSDNFATRYLVNDTCFFLKKPLVYGSIHRFDGQLSVFNYQNGPCLRCLFPAPPPKGLAPNCAETGVIGVLPGLVGVMQANEVIKITLGIGEVVSGRLLTVDALSMRFGDFALKKSADCPLCSDHATITELKMEHDACELAHQEISPEEFERWQKEQRSFVLLDVRNVQEYQAANLGGHLIPLKELSMRLSELDRHMRLVVHCASGQRSRQACMILREAGFRDVWNLKGGIIPNLAD